MVLCILVSDFKHASRGYTNSKYTCTLLVLQNAFAYRYEFGFHSSLFIASLIISMYRLRSSNSIISSINAFIGLPRRLLCPFIQCRIYKGGDQVGIFFQDTISIRVNLWKIKRAINTIKYVYTIQSRTKKDARSVCASSSIIMGQPKTTIRNSIFHFVHQHNLSNFNRKTFFLCLSDFFWNTFF